jgi:hypothetical protein
MNNSANEMRKFHQLQQVAKGNADFLETSWDSAVFDQLISGINAAVYEKTGQHLALHVFEVKNKSVEELSSGLLPERVDIHVHLLRWKQDRHYDRLMPMDKVSQ